MNLSFEAKIEHTMLKSICQQVTLKRPRTRITKELAVRGDEVCRVGGPCSSSPTPRPREGWEQECGSVSGTGWTPAQTGRPSVFHTISQIKHGCGPSPRSNPGGILPRTVHGAGYTWTLKSSRHITLKAWVREQSFSRCVRVCTHPTRDANALNGLCIERVHRICTEGVAGPKSQLPSMSSGVIFSLICSFYNSQLVHNRTTQIKHIYFWAVHQNMRNENMHHLIAIILFTFFPHLNATASLPHARLRGHGPPRPSWSPVPHLAQKTDSYWWPHSDHMGWSHLQAPRGQTAPTAAPGLRCFLSDTCMMPALLQVFILDGHLRLLSFSSLGLRLKWACRKRMLGAAAPL